MSFFHPTSNGLGQQHKYTSPRSMLQLAPGLAPAAPTGTAAPGTTAAVHQPAAASSARFALPNGSPALGSSTSQLVKSSYAPASLQQHSTPVPNFVQQASHQPIAMNPQLVQQFLENPGQPPTAAAGGTAGVPTAAVKFSYRNHVAGAAPGSGFVVLPGACSSGADSAAIIPADGSRHQPARITRSASSKTSSTSQEPRHALTSGRSSAGNANASTGATASPAKKMKQKQSSPLKTKSQKHSGGKMINVGEDEKREHEDDVQHVAPPGTTGNRIQLPPRSSPAGVERGGAVPVSGPAARLGGSTIGSSSSASTSSAQQQNLSTRPRRPPVRRNSVPGRPTAEQAQLLVAGNAGGAAFAVHQPMQPQHAPQGGEDEPSNASAGPRAGAPLLLYHQQQNSNAFVPAARTTGIVGHNLNLGAGPGQLHQLHSGQASSAVAPGQRTSSTVLAGGGPTSSSSSRGDYSVNNGSGGRGAGAGAASNITSAPSGTNFGAGGSYMSGHNFQYNQYQHLAPMGPLPRRSESKPEHVVSLEEHEPEVYDFRQSTGRIVNKTNRMQNDKDGEPRSSDSSAVKRFSSAQPAVRTGGSKMNRHSKTPYNCGGTSVLTTVLTTSSSSGRGMDQAALGNNGSALMPSMSTQGVNTVMCSSLSPTTRRTSDFKDSAMLHSNRAKNHNSSTTPNGQQVQHAGGGPASSTSKTNSKSSASPGAAGATRSSSSSGASAAASHGKNQKGANANASAKEQGEQQRQHSSGFYVNEKERKLENALLNKETQRRQEREIAHQRINTLQMENEVLKEKLDWYEKNLPPEYHHLTAQVAAVSQVGDEAYFQEAGDHDRHQILSSDYQGGVSSQGGSGSAPSSNQREKPRPPVYQVLNTGRGGSVEQNQTHSASSVPSKSSSNSSSSMQLRPAEQRLQAELQEAYGQIKDLEEKLLIQARELTIKQKDLEDLQGNVALREHQSSQQQVRKNPGAEVDHRAPSSQIKLSNQLRLLQRKVQVMRKSHELFKEEMVLVLAQLKPRLSMAASGVSSSSSSRGTRNTSANNMNHAMVTMDPVAKLAHLLQDYRRRLLKEQKDRRRLHNLVQELRGNIRVFCRVRPFLESDRTTPGTVGINGGSSSWQATTTINAGAGSTYASSTSSVLSARSGGANAGANSSIYLPEDSIDEIQLYNDYTLTTKTWQFDRVFKPQTSNEEVFDNGVRDLVTSCLDGFNICIFAYGPTGSGKTYSMAGTKQDPGIFLRSFQQLFAEIEARKPPKGNWKYRVSVGILEVYNEELRDLLCDNPADRKRSIKIDTSSVSSGAGPSSSQQQQTMVPNLTTYELSNMQEVSQVLEIGEQQRKTGCTNLNEHSSRSHYVIQVFVEGWDVLAGGVEKQELLKTSNTGAPSFTASSSSSNNQRAANNAPSNSKGTTSGGLSTTAGGAYYNKKSYFLSKMCLIDLAGSERLSKSGATGALQKETKLINKSLSALGDVISARLLKNTHIPFRNSTLTYLLQNCLSGDAKTLMLLQVSPADVAETACSLAFGARVNAVENNHQVVAGAPAVDR
ncbi:unnamed protein product [Amoebophrya sp. A120]|nr:unnamed protein product [Amoebophrya sp. A120]|eukprot:GSA120T00005906001.1